MNQIAPIQNTLSKWRAIAAAVAMVGAVLCAPAALERRGELLQAYLAGYLFWWSVTVGCLGIWLLYEVVGGRWGTAIRPLLQCGAATLPLVALGFLPIALGLADLYPWATSTAVASPPSEQFRDYLNPKFFRARAGGYFGVWFVLLMLLSATRRPAALVRIGSLGLVVLALTVSFASIDWGMSLTPHWYSTMYPVLYIVGGGLAALAGMTFCASGLARRGEPAIFSSAILADLGTLLLAFVMLWAYVTFSQYLIIWAGNMPEEVVWYVARLEGGWQFVALVVAVGGFAAPFALLLSRDVKQSPRGLMVVSAKILAIQWLNVLWIIAPTFRPALGDLTLADFGAPLLIGGLWVVLFLTLLLRRDLMRPAFNDADGNGGATQ